MSRRRAREDTRISTLVWMALPVCRAAQRQCPRTGPGKPPDYPDWQMAVLIMANPKKLEIADLRGYAQSLNLDLKQFDTVMADAEKINELLKADLAEAKKCKVRATPTVLINGLKMTNRTLPGYQSRINQILKKEVAAGN
jgi:protein-disulfide isomerase